jgi:hypothetical protein
MQDDGQRSLDVRLDSWRSHQSGGLNDSHTESARDLFRLFPHTAIAAAPYGDVPQCVSIEIRLFGRRQPAGLGADGLIQRDLC